jgi:hypothetical protein
MIRAKSLSAFAYVTAATLLLSATGCSICGTCFDYEYAAYGGATPRGDRIHGRVGSLFAPAEGGTVYHQDGMEVVAPGGDIELLPPPADSNPPMPPTSPVSPIQDSETRQLRSNLVPQRAVQATPSPVRGGREVTLPSGETVVLGPGEVLDTEMTAQQRSMLVR